MIRWPWVSRATYDAAVVWRTWYEQARGYNAELQLRYDTLLQKYHDLKVAGATPTPVPVERPAADPVAVAITQASGNSPRLRAMMAQEAARMRLAQFPDHEIVHAIQNGITSIEGLPV